MSSSISDIKKEDLIYSRRLKIKLWGIYQITSPTGSIYIGQSIDINKRLLDYHKLNCKNQPALYNSLKKHGPENHRFKIIFITMGPNKCKKELDFHERLHIRVMKEEGHTMLNIKPGGAGYAPTEGSKIKQSIMMIGKYVGEKNPNYGKGCFGKTNGMFGKNHTKESIDKILKTKNERYGKKWKENEDERERSRQQSILEWKEKLRINMSGVKIGKRKVVQLDENLNFISDFESMAIAAKSLEIHKAHISKSVLKKQFAPTTRFRFMYKEDYERFSI